jgi:hypothetical protein
VIVGDESPLRRLPAELNQRQTLFLDGIRISIESADLSYARLRNTLMRLARQGDGPGETPLTGPDTAAAMLDAWSIVDSIRRLRAMLSQMPNLARSPRLRVFLEETKTFDDLRNVVQHFETTIPEMVDAGEPLWGHLTWVVVADREVGRLLTCALVPGTIRSGRVRAVNPAGIEMRDETDHIILTCHGHVAKLSDALLHLERLTRSLEASLEPQVRERPQAGSDLLICLSVVAGAAAGAERHDAAEDDGQDQIEWDRTPTGGDHEHHGEHEEPGAAGTGDGQRRDHQGDAEPPGPTR